MERLSHTWLVLLLVLLCTLPLAAFADSAEERILVSLMAAHPAAQSVQTVCEGDIAAAVLTDGDTKVLCIWEKQADQWQLVCDNPKALLPNEPLPALSLNSDQMLQWQYVGDNGPSAFTTWKNLDGSWNPVGQNVIDHLTDGGRFVHQVQWSVDSMMTRWNVVYDAAEKLMSESADAFPAPWLADCIRPANFDVSRFPVYTFEEYDGQWPAQDFIREAARQLLPNDRFVSGSLSNGNLQFLMEKPDGTRVFAGVTGDANQLSICESSPLPDGSYYGVENFTNSLQINGLCVTLKKQENAPCWGVYSLMGYHRDSEDLIFGPNVLYRAEDPSTLCIGAHPWSDIRSIDWSTLPTSFDEAVDSVNGDDWAIVRNPNPQDRLHLREKPDKTARSLGKYYSGTPVRVLESVGAWTRVNIGGIVEGWMMTEYLSFQQPYVVSLNAMPELYFKNGSAELYAQPNTSAECRVVTNDYGMKVIGVIGDEWTHVWFPLTAETGYIMASELFKGNG
ncbi:MAG: SH3 domain-containing protein [Eubacteriales bacterium]|nr:SH3 domain-containing protein [Eubacteriales bacterium]